jgi:hypothetical protein
MNHRYDPAERAAAAEIQTAHPNWVIMFGAHSRMFYAYPLFPAPPGAMLAASSPPDLLADMHRAELTCQHHPGPRRPRPG